LELNQPSQYADMTLVGQRRCKMNQTTDHIKTSSDVIVYLNDFFEGLKLEILSPEKRLSANKNAYARSIN
jgi:hypothetical protein